MYAELPCNVRVNNCNIGYGLVCNVEQKLILIFSTIFPKIMQKMLNLFLFTNLWTVFRGYYLVWNWRILRELIIRKYTSAKFSFIALGYL